MSCCEQLSYSLCLIYESKEFKFALHQFDCLRGVCFLSFLCFQEIIFSLFAAPFPYPQGLTILAFNNERFDSKTLREVLSLGPTYVVMKFLESMFLWLLSSPKVLLIYQYRTLIVPESFTYCRCSGCYHDVWCILYIKTCSCQSDFPSFCLVQHSFCVHMFPLCVCSFFFFMGFTKFLTLILPSPFSFFSSFCGNPPLLYCGITFGHVSCDRKALEDSSNQNSNSTLFRIYVVVLAIYAGVQFFVSFLLRIPACHSLTSRCDNWSVVRFIKWMHQVSHFLSDFFEG